MPSAAPDELLELELELELDVPHEELEELSVADAEGEALDEDVLELAVPLVPEAAAWL